MPKLIACGGRKFAYDRFKNLHRSANAGDFVALLVDSEDVPIDIKKTWDHLKNRDGWDKPQGADDRQVLMMTTCMETWIASDRNALRNKFKENLKENHLPALVSMESRHRDDVISALENATRTCKKQYVKSNISFELVGELNPQTLSEHLPSFKRCKDILQDKL